MPPRSWRTRSRGLTYQRAFLPAADPVMPAAQRFFRWRMTCVAMCAYRHARRLERNGTVRDERDLFPDDIDVVTPATATGCCTADDADPHSSFTV